MIERLTRPKDEWECRIKDCPIEEWLENSFDVNLYEVEPICQNCPLEKIVNKLAEYEDKEECLEHM